MAQAAMVVMAVAMVVEEMAMGVLGKASMDWAGRKGWVMVIEEEALQVAQGPWVVVARRSTLRSPHTVERYSKGLARCDFRTTLRKGGAETVDMAAMVTVVVHEEMGMVVKVAA